MKQHRGDLQVTSKGLGRGTTFAFTLPLYQIPDEPPDTTAISVTNTTFEDLVKARDKEDSGSLRVLVVDDVATNRKLLRRLVSKHGHFVDDADNGQVAVSKVEEALKENDPYDTILMDYEMPVLRGPEAAKLIREMGCSSFIVGITGNVLAEDVRYFTSCGANAVLPKPVQMEKLEELWVEHGVSGHFSRARPMTTGTEESN